MTATPKDFELLKIGKLIQIYHSPRHCEDGQSGLIEFLQADPFDLLALDEFRCTACNNRMATSWFTAEYADWVSDRYMSNSSVKCECGSAKLGIKPFTPGHSHWCPAAAI